MATNSCTLYGSSTALLSQHVAGATAFPQSGSWSWVSLIDNGVQGAISVLARYSAGGVDQYTVIVGQLLCTKFRLKPSGLDRLRDAITELPSMRTIGAMLHFGFGVDSIVRNLASTIEGGTLVALCASAMDTFHEDHAANIFVELVRAFEPPEGRTPSPMQWKALIRACAGSLAGTPLPQLVERFMQMDSSNNRLFAGRGDRDLIRGVSSPDSVASALLAIGQVSTSELLHVTIVGGSDAGWLAAIAEWLFDLRVSIVEDMENRVIYATSQFREPQVTIRYASIVSTEGFMKQDELAIRTKTCCLQDITIMFVQAANPFGSAAVSSRVPWATALTCTFGNKFAELMNFPRTVAEILVSAGQIYMNLSRSDRQFDKHDRRNCKTYFASGIDRGFTSFALALFPELADLKPLIDTAHELPHADALTRYDSQIGLLKQGCGCHHCDRRVVDIFADNRFCLVMLVETIISIVHCMSGVSAPDNLQPMRSGLEAQYSRQVKIHKSEKLRPRMKRYGAAGAIMESYSTDCSDWDIDESVAVPRLVQGLRIFTGRGIHSSAHEQVAICRYGIVAFLDCVIKDKLSLESESLGRCIIMPGHIEMYGRLHQHLEDLSDYDFNGWNYRVRSQRIPRHERGTSPSKLTDDFTFIDAAVQEDSTTARVGLVFRTNEGRVDSDFVLVGPAKSMAAALAGTGMIQCDGKSCMKQNLPSVAPADHTCVRLLRDQNDCAIWSFNGSDMGQIVALNQALMWSPEPHIILQQDQCLDCCVKDSQLSEKSRAVIIGRRQRLLGRE